MATPPGYIVQTVLYEGPSSLVRRAVRTADQQVVILKSAQGHALSLDPISKFRWEFELLQSFHHELIIKALRLEIDGQAPSLVLEEFEGATDLRAALPHYLWPSPALLPLWIQLARAVEVVHGHSIIHKDINPNNILVHPQAQTLKLIDFGRSSRFGFEEATFQSPSALEGTLPYISPEQTGRANRSLDERSDFYSLGVTFYELASGRLPFQSVDPLELVYAHLARRATPLHELIPAFPESLSQIVAKLMEKAPERRYQSASGLRRDLEVA